jgi:hypothetical protein
MHGWPLSADSWDDQTMAIADSGFRAIAYDVAVSQIQEPLSPALPRSELLKKIQLECQSFREKSDCGR